MGRGDAAGELLEEGHADLGELGGLDDVQDLLQLVEEHHLQGAQPSPAHRQPQGEGRWGTSLGEWTLGQYLRRPCRMTASVSVGSFSRNWTTQ